LNGVDLNVPKGAIYDTIIAVATGQAGKPEAAEFFGTHSMAA